MDAVGAVILAAGGSTRLGRPKQLLLNDGSTLIRHAAEAACGAGCRPVVVVAGDDRERIEQALGGLEAAVFHHPNWARGIGSSIRAGVAKALVLDPDLDALVMMVCDQPWVSSGLLRTLVAARPRHESRAAACAYGGTLGVPAVFDRSQFAQLGSLPDEQGAKQILASLRDRLATVDFPGGSVDIDTEADCQAYLKP